MRLLDTGGVGGRLRLKSVAEPAIVHGYHTRSVDAPFTNDCLILGPISISRGITMSDVYKGSCFCGAVEIEVSGAPAAMGYCHCDDCTI